MREKSSNTDKDLEGTRVVLSTNAKRPHLGFLNAITETSRANLPTKGMEKIQTKYEPHE